MIVGPAVELDKPAISEKSHKKTRSGNALGFSASLPAPMEATSLWISASWIKAQSPILALPTLSTAVLASRRRPWHKP